MVTVHPNTIMKKNNHIRAKSQLNPPLGKRPFILAAALLVSAAATGMADSYWQGGTSDFNNPASWNNGYVPIVSSPQNNADNDSGSNNVCLIQPGDPAWGPWDIRAGDGANTSGAFWQTGDTVTVGGWFRLADGTGSAGYYRLDNGTLNCQLQAHVGEYGDGLLTINGGTMTVAQDPFCMGDADFGPSPTGTLIMNGGTITTATGVEIWLGEGNSGRAGTGTLLLTNGAINIGSWFAIGRFGGIGDLEMAGGSITMAAGNNGNITLATTPGTGLVNQSGGAITNTLTQTWIAESSVGTWNLNGGLDVLGVVHITQTSGGVGTFNLNGGDLVVNEITDNGGNGTFNFNGGTLHAGTSTLNLLHDVNGGVYLQAGGANINTEGNDATIAQPLIDAGGGGLIKLGAGTLTLSGASSYLGQTVVSNGTLMVGTASFADGTYTVEDNAGFGVILANAGTQFSPSTVTLGTTSGSSLSFDLGSFGNPTIAPLNVIGTLTVNGTTTVNITDADPQIGQFHLLQYGTKAGTGTFTLGTLPTGVVATLVNNAGYLDLNITGVALDVWTGAVNSNWDINTTLNWINGGTLATTEYTDGDVVQFDDTATGTTNITLVTNVAPGTVTFANNVLSYTLSGNGGISGPTHVTYSGHGMVTMETTNSYTGATILNGANGGTLVVSNLANGGVASPIGASAATPNNLVLNGGTLSYQGSPVTINRGYALTANYGLNGTVGTNSGALDVVGNLTLTGPATATVGSSFVKTGPGTLTYAGAVTNQLSGGNDPGYQVVAGTLVFDGSAGHQVNHSQQEFWIGDTTNSGANIILTNTTLNVDSWFSLSRGNGDSGFVCNANLYNSALNCGNLSLGWNNGRPNQCSQNFTMTNSTINDGGNFLIAESAGSVGNVFITGNSVVNVSGGNPMLMGLSSGATGNVFVADSSIVTNHAWLSCGANGYGTLTLKNNAFYAEGSDFNFGDYGAAYTTGILTIQDNAQVAMIGTGNGVYVGKTSGSIGIVYQSGNTVINARSAGVWQLGQQSGSQGTWYQSGGTNYAGGWVSIGRGAVTGDSSPYGLTIVSGGLFDQVSTGNGLIVGEQGTGTLVVTNNGVVLSEANNIGVAIGWNGGVGEVDLGGGTLIANFIQGGTGNSTFNFNGGLLRAGANTQRNFMTNLSSVVVMSGANIDTGTNTIDIASSLNDGGMGGGLTKTGNGTLLLDGANFYSGTTTISAGTLGGSGTISGPVVINGGATFAPGDLAVGTLMLNSTLNLAGTSQTVMLLNKTTSTSSAVSGASSITYGGTLVLQNTSGTLQAGDTFTLFGAGAYTGSFSSVVSHTPGQTVTWDLSQLNVNGSVKVASAAASPVTLAPAMSSGKINLAWPASQTGWQLQEQSNPLSVGISTNWVPVAGSTSTNQVSIPVGSGSGSMFFRLFFHN